MGMSTLRIRNRPSVADAMGGMYNDAFSRLERQACNPHSAKSHRFPCRLSARRAKERTASDAEPLAKWAMLCITPTSSFSWRRARALAHHVVADEADQVGLAHGHATDVRVKQIVVNQFSNGFRVSAAPASM